MGGLINAIRRVIEQLSNHRKDEIERTYFSTRPEAEHIRRKGDRIYYTPGKGYHVVKIERPFWSY